MGSKTGSGSTNTTTTVNSVPPQVLANYNYVADAAKYIGQKPYTPYTGEGVAGINSAQQTAMGQINGAYGTGQPYTQQASAATTQGMGPISADHVGAGTVSPGQVYGNTVTPTGFSQAGLDQYLSPYNQNVIDATRANMQENDAVAQNGVVGNAIARGAWGGDRAGVAQAELARQQGLADNQVIAGLYNQNYQQALGEFNNQQQAGIQTGEFSAGQNLQAQQANQQYGYQGQLANAQMGLQAGLANQSADLNAAENNGSRALQAGAQYGALGTTAFNQAEQGAAANLAAANQVQQNQQQQDTYNKTLYDTGQQYPFQTTSWLSGILTGLGNQGSTSAVTSPAASTASQVAGAATAGVGILGATGAFGSSGWLSGLFTGSDERIKENIQPVGTLHDGQPIYRYNYKGDPRTQIGLIAQDVAQSHPESVANLGGGVLGVNYDTATRDAARVPRADGGVLDPTLAPALTGTSTASIAPTATASTQSWGHETFPGQDEQQGHVTHPDSAGDIVVAGYTIPSTGRGGSGASAPTNGLTSAQIDALLAANARNSAANAGTAPSYGTASGSFGSGGGNGTDGGGMVHDASTSSNSAPLNGGGLAGGLVGGVLGGAVLGLPGSLIGGYLGNKVGTSLAGNTWGDGWGGKDPTNGYNFNSANTAIGSYADPAAANPYGGLYDTAAPMAGPGDGGGYHQAGASEMGGYGGGGDGGWGDGGTGGLYAKGGGVRGGFAPGGAPDDDEEEEETAPSSPTATADAQGAPTPPAAIGVAPQSLPAPGNPAGTPDHAGMLSARGIAPTAANLRTAEILGPSGGVQFLHGLQEDPTAPATKYVSREAFQANPEMFTNPDGTPKTVSQVYNTLSSQAGGGDPRADQPSANAQTTDFKPPGQADKPSNGLTDQDKWMALTMAGLGIMGGTSPQAGVNIGQGAQKGIEYLSTAKAANLSQARADLEAKRLAEEAAQHKIDNDNKTKQLAISQQQANQTGGYYDALKQHYINADAPDPDGTKAATKQPALVMTAKEIQQQWAVDHPNEPPLKFDEALRRAQKAPQEDAMNDRALQRAHQSAVADQASAHPKYKSYGEALDAFGERFGYKPPAPAAAPPPAMRPDLPMPPAMAPRPAPAGVAGGAPAPVPPPTAPAPAPGVAAPAPAPAPAQAPRGGVSGGYWSGHGDGVPIPTPAPTPNAPLDPNVPFWRQPGYWTGHGPATGPRWTPPPGSQVSPSTGLIRTPDGRIFRPDGTPVQ